MIWQSFAEQAIPLILIFFVFYAIVIRPGRKLDWERYKTILALKGGEKVLTHGYMFGTFIRAEKDIYFVELAPGMVVSMQQHGIRKVLDDQENQITIVDQV